MTKSNSFLEMIDFEKLSKSLKNINIKLKEERSKEWLLILSIENTRKIIQHIQKCMETDSISDDQRIEMIKNIIVIHQDLNRITSDRELSLSDEFYEQARDTIENLIIFYPVFIFNKSLADQKREA